MRIRELFVKQIDRPINGVIKADQRDDESVWQELDEYVATKEVTEYLRRFFDAYLATVDHPNDTTITARMGVWVSGFFGSGKSHFIKILSYLLSNLEAARPGDGGKRAAVDFFNSKVKDPMLLGDIRRAVTSNTDVVLFNIDAKADSKSDRDAILQVFLRVFNEMQGLSGDAPHVAEMERYLISKGAYEAFKQAFKVANGNDWGLSAMRSIFCETMSSPASASRWICRPTRRRNGSTTRANPTRSTSKGSRRSCAGTSMRKARAIASCFWSTKWGSSLGRTPN